MGLFLFLDDFLSKTWTLLFSPYFGYALLVIIKTAISLVGLSLVFPWMVIIFDLAIFWFAL
jgi:hypothetical protein